MDLWTHETLWGLHLHWTSTSIKGKFFSLDMSAQKIFVRSWSDSRAFIFRLPCVGQTLVRSFQTFVRSCSDFRAFTSCIHQSFVRSCPDFRAFIFTLSCVHVQTFVRSFSDFRAFVFRLPCVHQTFVRSFSDFRAFLMFPDYVNLNARRPFVRSSSVWTYLLQSGTSIWVRI